MEFKTRSQEFIWKNRKRLSDGPAFFNPDTSFMPKEKFDAAKLKFLLVFPTPLITKTVSSTFAAINDYVIEHCPDVFLDCAYMPEGSDIKIYDDANMPYAIGEITHLDASHFDVVGFSISVLSEIVTAPVMLKSFERCDKPIPLFWSERKDLSVNECPIIYTGGITENCGDSMFGEPLPGKIAYIDFQYLGACDKTDVLFNRLIEAKETGIVHRSVRDNDKLGYHHEDPVNFETELKVSTIQDYVECLFDLDFIYQPQAYKVVFNKDNQIIENTKINPKARDFVTPYYPHQMPDDLGIGRTLINANGANTGTTQTQVSDGCSAGGQCSFKVAKGTRIWTSKGLVKIEDAVNTPPRVTGLNVIEACEDVVKQSKAIKVVVTTHDGFKLECDDNHKWLVVDGDILKEVKTIDLKKGDVILRRLNSFDTDNGITPEFAEFLGFMHGDGCFSKPYGKSKARWKIYMNEFERLKYESLFRKFVPTNAKTRIHYQSGNTIIYVIEGNAVDYGYDVAAVSGAELYIPDCIFQASKESRCAYLRGIFQADGYFTADLAMTTISAKYAQDIALLLASVGIDSTIRTNEYFERNPLDGHKISYFVRIAKPFVQKFINEIGFVTKNHEVTPVGNRTKANLTNTEFISDIIRKKYKRDVAREEGLGQFFERPLDKISDYEWRKLPIWVSLPEKSVRRLVASGDFVTDTVESVISTYELEDMYDVVGTTSSWCVYGDILTHNCSEGAYTGGWVEKRRERILEELWEAKKYSAGYKYKPFSFNCNYVTDYKGILAEFIKIYPKVTFINMRLEELGRDTDALRIMKAIGSNRISAPIEGLSPRVQNNLLNKCLSQEAFDNFMFDLVHMKMTDIKVGGIYTGYETDEDFQWICDYVHKFKEKAKDEGGNLPFRLKMTPLVSYPLTACEYIERKSARKSYNGERWLSDYWYEKFKENEIFFKVNGFRYSTFLEQSIVDLGRSLTPMIYRHFVEPMAPIYSLRSVATDEFVSELKAFINPDKFFELRDPEHYISIAHRIHIDLMGSYIPRARRLIRAYRNGNIFDNEMDIRCLKTFDGAKVKCYHNCIKDDPLKIYRDVKMDEEGNLHGEYDLLLGCERCQTPEQRRARLARPTPQTKNVDDIIAVPRIPQVQKIRFVLKRNKDYDVLNPNNTSHTFMTKFLQLSDNLLHKYHSIVNHNLFWNADEGLPYFVSGFQIVDTIWQDDVISEVRNLIPEVNKLLKSVQVVSAKEELMDEKIKPDDYNIFYFESELPLEMFSASSRMYDGEIKVMGGGMQGAIETIIDKSIKQPVFASRGKTVGFFAIKAQYNPILYLSSFLKAKKISPAQVAQSTTIDCVMTMRETSTVCKHCGNEKAMISVTTGKSFPLGLNCVLKALLSQRLKG